MSALFPALFATRSGLVLILNGYFDESMSPEGTQPICVAGYLFKPKGYRHFCTKWARLLKAGPTPTTHFHMSRLHAIQGEYKGWSAEDRAKVLGLAVDAVRKHAYSGVQVLFSQIEFEQIVPGDWLQRHGSMYSVACQMALQTSGFWLRERGNEQPVAYFFERGQQFWNEANAILNNIGKHHPDAKAHLRYHSHTFIDKVDAYGLQAADMFAWLGTRLNVGVPQNQSIEAFTPHFLRLVENRDDRYQMFHPKGEKLRRFIEENATTAPVITAGIQRTRRSKARLR